MVFNDIKLNQLTHICFQKITFTHLHKCSKLYLLQFQRYKPVWTPRLIRWWCACLCFSFFIFSIAPWAAEFQLEKGSVLLSGRLVFVATALAYCCFTRECFEMETVKYSRVAAFCLNGNGVFTETVFFSQRVPEWETLTTPFRRHIVVIWTRGKNLDDLFSCIFIQVVSVLLLTAQLALAYTPLWLL